MQSFVIKAVKSGVLAGIIMGIISMILYALKICRLCIIAIGGGMYSGKMLDTYNLYGLTLAWLTHFALNAVFGILIALILYYTGTKYNIIKGAGLLTLVYLANIGVIAPMRGVFSRSDDYFSFLLLLFYHILFGSLASFLIVRFKTIKNTD